MFMDNFKTDTKVCLLDKNENNAQGIVQASKFALWKVHCGSHTWSYFLSEHSRGKFHVKVYVPDFLKINKKIAME
jgi:hypothetical protein